jgi:hypothetical protein
MANARRGMTADAEKSMGKIFEDQTASIKKIVSGCKE